MTIKENDGKNRSCCRQRRYVHAVLVASTVGLVVAFLSMFRDGTRSLYNNGGAANPPHLDETVLAITTPIPVSSTKTAQQQEEEQQQQQEQKQQKRDTRRGFTRNAVAAAASSPDQELSSSTTTGPDVVAAATSTASSKPVPLDDATTASSTGNGDKKKEEEEEEEDNEDSGDEEESENGSDEEDEEDEEGDNQNEDGDVEDSEDDEEDEDAESEGESEEVDLTGIEYDQMEFHHLYAYYNCSKEYGDFQQRKILSDAEWMLLRGLYRAAVGPSQSSIRDPLNATSGFEVPHEVKYSEGKGRGIFAKEFIPKGTLVYTGAKNGAHYTSGKQYRDFLKLVPKELVCDVMEWSYTLDLKTPEEQQQAVVERHLRKRDRPHDWQIITELDDGCLCNDGEGSTYANIDIACPMVGKKKKHLYQNGNCRINYHAIRDIQPGEEFLCNYGSIAAPEHWTDFGL